MIPPRSIQQQARKAKVRDSQIEKDYVLSWVLYGIRQQLTLAEALVFKGGTVLKKVYFETYRYSEDLDFTLLDDQLTDKAILHGFTKVFAWVLEQANIPLEITQVHAHERRDIHFYISYRGPLGGLGMHKRLKVDITRGEQLEFVPVRKNVFCSYADLEDFSLLCYPLEEVLIEKMCALLGRTEPRDLYDLWYLLEIEGMDWVYYWPEFERKAKHKGHNAAQFLLRVHEKLHKFKARWEGSLVAQIHLLPAFEQVSRELGKHWRKIKAC